MSFLPDATASSKRSDGRASGLPGYPVINALGVLCDWISHLIVRAGCIDTADPIHEAIALAENEVRASVSRSYSLDPTIVIAQDRAPGVPGQQVQVEEYALCRGDRVELLNRSI